MFLTSVIQQKFVFCMLYQVHLALVGLELTTLVVIGTECIGSCKSKYHPITTMTAPYDIQILCDAGQYEF